MLCVLVDNLPGVVGSDRLGLEECKDKPQVYD